MEATPKALINGYIQKAEKKLDVAERLFKSGDFEDAVSRAYYATFHSAQVTFHLSLKCIFSKSSDNLLA